MKVSFDAKRLFNNFTGLGNYSRTLVGNLQRIAPLNQYVLYTPKLRQNAETEYFADSSRFGVVLPKCKKLKSLWRSWGVIRNINNDKVDIYHGLSHDLPFSVKAKRSSRVKYVVTIHDLCYRTFPDMFSWLERRIYRYKYSHSLKVADAIVAISDSTKQDILKYFPWVEPTKIHTIYQSLDPLYYTPMPMSQAKEIVAKRGVKGEFILSVGSINSRKNLLGVLKAYAMIAPDKRLPLVIIGGGRGAYKKKVIEYVLQNKLSEHVCFVDNIKDNNTLQAFYTAATALVYPSFYEGFGLPVAEALLCGTPAITSSVSSLPEAGGDGAIYVDPSSVKQIASAIERLSCDRDYGQELAQKGREYVLTNLDTTKLTQQMLGLYELLVK